MASNPFVLPASIPTNHTEQDVVASLDSMFTNFPPAANQYSMYFQLMPVARSVNDLQGLLSGAIHQPDKVITQQVHAVQNAIGINAVAPSNLANLDVFSVNQPPGPDSGPQNSVFIVIDGFNNARVPIEIACLMEANFIDGFVTRLVLGQFKRFWDSNPDTASSSGYALSRAFGIDLGALTANQASLLLFSQPSSYPPYLVIPALGRNTGQPTYEDDLSVLLSQNRITSIGMLYGWRAAEQLEQADGQNAAQPLVSNAFRLLGFRLSTRDLGEMTAFTLNYLNGAVQNESIRSIIGGSTPIAPPALEILLEKLGDDEGLNAAKNFMVGFENVLAAELYAISQNNDAGLAPEKLKLLAQQFSFLEGFHDGIAKSADAHYEETLELAFGLGYTSGFIDGYALGYSNGYNDGFAAGNAAAWKAADTIIGSLRDQITKLQTQLSAVQSSQNGGGSGDGFWNTLGKVSSVVKTAIGVISTLTGAIDAAGAA